MRAALPVLSALLLTGCGPAPDPPLETGKSELASFLAEAVLQATGSHAPTNRVAAFRGPWSSRVLTPKNVSTRYVLPQGWQALQVSTGATNLAPIRDWLTASLGAPINLGDSAKGIAWQPVPRAYSVWLSGSNDVCMLQISAPAPKKPEDLDEK